VLTGFEGRTAVVTGAASGIGLGLARRCAARGMNVVMLDIEQPALDDAAQLVGEGEHVVARTVDVADPRGMESVATEVFSRFDAVHLLCNNAGVMVAGPTWTMTADDFRWVTDVNLGGVLNGVRAFVPRMLERGEQGHLVNTASFAGLVSTPNASLYSATKAGVVALSEALFHELSDAGSPIGVSVLCPGLVDTKIILSTRNRPAALPEVTQPRIPDEVLSYFATGADPLVVADRVLTAVERNDFYVLTNKAARPSIAARMEALVNLGDPARPEPGATQAD